MPYEIAIVTNPRPKKAGKKRVKKMAKRKRKGRMPPQLAAYWAKRRGRKANPRRKKRRSNPRVKHHARRATRAVTRHRKRHANPRVHSRRRRRHNPRFSLGGIKSQLMPALIGAGGAIALDVALGYVPLPTALQSPIAKTGVKVVGALGLGWAASKMLGREKGKAVAAGALTVVAYGLLRDLAHKYLPTLPGLAGDFEEVDLGYLNPAPLLVDDSGMPDAGAGAYMDAGTGAYMDGYMDGYND